MPANLPPDYHAAEQRFREAKSVEDRITALEEMLRIMPKHKGTDKLQADIKARLAKLRKQPAKKGARRVSPYQFDREGAGQVALVGAPNAGKSALVAKLTHAHPDVADYPFTTREPTPGMMPFEDVAFQLIDLPPLSHEHIPPWVFDIIRGADTVWLVADGRDPLDAIGTTRDLLRDKNITLHPPDKPPETDPRVGEIRKKTLLVLTRLDDPEVRENLEVLDELLEEPWSKVPVSCETGEGLDALRLETFRMMEILRVYTKQPGKPADREQPFTLAIGATVGDLAVKIHKDIAEQMKFARIWGESAFDGQSVQRDHVLAEGDVVEIHV